MPKMSPGPSKASFKQAILLNYSYKDLHGIDWEGRFKTARSQLTRAPRSHRRGLRRKSC